MKKSIFILITLALTSIVGQAQTNVYHQFPDSNAQWRGEIWYKSSTTTVTYDSYSLIISGDTTIGSFVYHKLYKSGNVYTPPGPPSSMYYYNNIYAGAFRQDIPNRKVYLHKSGVDNLAYDFNLNVGDTLKTCLTGYSVGVRIYSIDSVLVGNQYHKAFNTGCIGTGGYYKLIEGIGSMFGAFEPIVCPFEMGSDLYCVRIGTTTAWALSSQYNCDLGASIPDNFIKTNKVVIFQNPFSNETTLTFKTVLNKVNLIIYNSAGQVVKQIKNISGQSYILNRENLEAGIYFLRVLENNNVVATEKFIITDN